jgi:hypothetical protein
VNRLLEIEKASHEALLEERAALAALSVDRATILAERQSIQRMLDERDRQFAELHAGWVAMRRDPLWRFANMIRNDLRRILRIFGRGAG